MPPRDDSLVMGCVSTFLKQIILKILKDISLAIYKYTRQTRFRKTVTMFTITAKKKKKKKNSYSSFACK